MSSALHDYIASFPGGAPAYAALLGVTESAVYRWLRRERTPDVNRIYLMIQESEGQLTFEKIWESCTPATTCYGATKRARQ